MTNKQNTNQRIFNMKIASLCINNNSETKPSAEEEQKQPTHARCAFTYNVTFRTNHLSDSDSIDFFSVLNLLENIVNQAPVKFLVCFCCCIATNHFEKP